MRSRRCRHFPAFALPTLLAHLIGSVAFAQEWTRFRGPNGSGIGQATSIPASWDDDDYNWRVDLPGRGHSSPVLWERTLFVMSGDADSGRRMVLAIDSHSGATIWNRKFASQSHRTHKLNNLASSTPAVDGDVVVVAWGTPRQITIAALAHDGKVLWQVERDPFEAGHGFGVSPVIHHDLVIVPLEHSGDSVWLGLDRKTGVERWKIDRDSGLHYATPCVVRAGSSTQLVFTNWEYGITGVDSASGRIVWNHNVFDKKHLEASIGSPIVAGDLVIGVCGYLGYGNEVVAVRPAVAESDSDDNGVVWRVASGAPLTCTPLATEGLVFLWSDSGIVTCLDAGTGAVHWKKRAGGTFYSSPVCVSGRLYNVSADGDVVVLAAGKDYEQFARVPLGEICHATPAVANGVMYFRTETKLYSLGGDAERVRGGEAK